MKLLINYKIMKKILLSSILILFSFLISCDKQETKIKQQEVPKKVNGPIETEYFKGELKDGKMVGMWTFYFYSCTIMGKYNNGPTYNEEELISKIKNSILACGDWQLKDLPKQGRDSLWIVKDKKTGKTIYEIMHDNGEIIYDIYYSDRMYWITKRKDGYDIEQYFNDGTPVPHTRNEVKAFLIGKTKEQVKKYYGPPRSTSQFGTREYWYYGGISYDEISEKEDKSVQIVFENGRVDHVNF